MKTRTIQKSEPRRDWRCAECFKLLGRRSNDRLELRFARGHRYLTKLPASCVCRCCGTLNTLPG